MKARFMLLIMLAAASLLFYVQEAPAAEWVVPGDFPTIQRAISSGSVLVGDTIYVRPGSHRGANVTKAVTIYGLDGAKINSGPAVDGLAGMTAGFYFTGIGGAGNGAEIRNLQFESLDFPIYSKGADGVSVRFCTMLNPLQGITSWDGNSWNIRSNTITNLRTSCGGGIGILLGGRLTGHTSQLNDVYLNTLTGVLAVPADDCGNYIGAGVSLMADFRQGVLGLSAVTTNHLGSAGFGNTISLTSNRPAKVEAYGIMLNEIQNPTPANYAVQTNFIAGNTISGNEVGVRPSGLCGANTITGYTCPSSSSSLDSESGEEASGHDEARLSVRAY